MERMKCAETVGESIGLTAHGAQDVDQGIGNDAVYASVREVLERARGSVALAVNSAMVNAYWEIGR